MSPGTVAPLSASHHHPIIQDVTVHLLSPLPLPSTVSERAITTRAEYKGPLTTSLWLKGKTHDLRGAAADASNDEEESR